MSKQAEEFYDQVDLDMTLREIILKHAMVYINSQGHGTGHLFLKGNRVKGIQALNFTATTDDFTHQNLDVVVGLHTESVKLSGLPDDATVDKLQEEW